MKNADFRILQDEDGDWGWEGIGDYDHLWVPCHLESYEDALDSAEMAIALEKAYE